MSPKKSAYYLPSPSHWPIIGSIAIFITFMGAANWIHGHRLGMYLCLLGFVILCIMLVGWFGAVIQEGRLGLLKNSQVDRSFRLAMLWFIFTEVMFFAAFFAALFYARFYAVPILGGLGDHLSTHTILWPNFKAIWPLLQTPDTAQFKGPNEAMEVWGIPALNTLILLTSGATITIAHWSLIKKNHARTIFFQFLTIVLGVVFIMIQAHEYWSAYMIKSLRLDSGIYGNTFFMLTGFHAAHVSIGIIALTVILWRLANNDFTKRDHFAFQGVSWYWHFIDVVWLMLFITVYWM